MPQIYACLILIGYSSITRAYYWRYLICNGSQATNRCTYYTFRLPKGIWHNSTPATFIQIIILQYSKSNIFLHKLFAYSKEEVWVIVDGSTSVWIPVKSGVPQGTMLGPLMFLIILMTLGTKYHLLFGFLLMIVCFIYRTVTSLEDSKQLQCDLDSILQWSQI